MSSANLDVLKPGPLTKEEIANVKVLLEKLLNKRPDISMPRRLFTEDENIDWRFTDEATGKGKKPDYALADYAYAIGKQCNHFRDPDILKSSPESIVEDLVKTWEMERSHKPAVNQQCSVN